MHPQKGDEANAPSKRVKVTPAVDPSSQNNAPAKGVLGPDDGAPAKTAGVNDTIKCVKVTPAVDPSSENNAPAKDVLGPDDDAPAKR